jgi:hypothetical protein
MTNSSQRAYSPRIIVSASVFGALAIVLPMVFHLVSLGHVFMPMFIPISLASFLLPLPPVIALCVVVPIFSSLLTGMPPLLMPPIGIIMIAELVTLASMNRLFTARGRLPIFFAALIGAVISRAVYLALVFVMADILHLPHIAFSVYSLVKTLPGSAVLVFVVPSLVRLTEKYV